MKTRLERIEEARKQADRIYTYSEWEKEFPLMNDAVKRMVQSQIFYNQFYGYIRTESNEKIFVTK